MDTRMLDKKINKAYGYQFYLIMGFFILLLSIALIAMQMAGVLRGSQDEEIIRLVTIGVTIFSVLLIAYSFFLMYKKKNYSKLLQIDEQAVAEIAEDAGNLELNTSTFALGRKYAYFYGKLVKNNCRFLCVKYEELARAEFARWRMNEQILFYDSNGGWIATVGGYKSKSQAIKNILTDKGVSLN